MASQVISLINAARAFPDRTSQSIYEQLKNSFKGNTLNFFGKTVQTFQGVKAVEDFGKYMHFHNNPVHTLIDSPALNFAAEEIAKEKGQKGQLTHEKPKVIYQKVQKKSKVEGKIGQLICLNTSSPKQTVSYFLIDDGLASRKRRRMLLDPIYHYIGVGQANHSVHGSIVVILLAEKIIQ